MSDWGQRLFFVAALVAAVGLGAGAAVLPGLAAMVGLAVLWFLAHRRFGSLLTSPVQIVSTGLIALAVLGRLFYADVESARGGSSIQILMYGPRVDQAFHLILGAAASILAGALLVTVFMKRPRDRTLALQPVELSPGLTKAAALLAPIPLVILILGHGGGLWSRSFYIAAQVGGNRLVSIAASLALGAVAALGFLWGEHRSRFYVAAVTLGYFAVFFGLGTRRLALVPILFALGAFVAAPSRRAKVWLVIAGVASLYLVGLPLALRSGLMNGIDPYWHELPSVMGSSLPFDTTTLNVLSGFGIIWMTAYGIPPIPTHDLWVSINPLPGNLAGWTQIAGDHRLNYYTPFGGIGALGNAGWEWVLGVGLLVGALLAFLDVRVGRFLREGRPVVALVLLALSVVVLIFLTQYPLRSSFRMLYYAAAFALVVPWWKPRRPEARVAGRLSAGTSSG